MSRKEPVSREIFSAAADEILTETGDTPKLQQLRDKVGGSFTTLSPLLNEWKAQQRQQTVAVLEMPETVVSALKTASADIWKAASQATGERIQQIEQEASAKIEAAQSEAAEYSEEIIRLEAALEQATAAADKADQEAQQSAARVTDLQIKNANLETSLSDKTAEHQKLETRHDQLQERFDQRQTECSEEVTRLETSLDQVTGDASTLR